MDAVAARAGVSKAHGSRELVYLQEVDLGERPAILRRYLECATGARSHIPVDRRLSVKEFENIAEQCPRHYVMPEAGNAREHATYRTAGHGGTGCQTLVMAAERPRRVEVRSFPSNRRLVTAAMRAGRSKMPMYGLVDVDITTANRLLAGHDPPLSLTAFVVASVARAAAAHPAVHAYRNWRGQLVTHRQVDVGTMVEISTPQGQFAIPHLLRDADIREVPDLTAELRRVKRDPSASSSGRWLERVGPAATRIPGVIPAMYAVMARSVAARQRIGTVAVTAVGMFAGGGGLGITPLSLMSLEIIVGGVSQRPRVIEGQVTVRDVLDLTIAIDHNVVDGAPAARFAAEFRELLETATVLLAPSGAVQARG